MNTIAAVSFIKAIIRSKKKIILVKIDHICLSLDHESYRFHITLAYLVRWMSSDEATRFKVEAEELFFRMASHLEPFDLEPAQLCVFEDMTRFVPALSI